MRHADKVIHVLEVVRIRSTGIRVEDVAQEIRVTSVVVEIVAGNLILGVSRVLSLDASSAVVDDDAKELGEPLLFVDVVVGLATNWVNRESIRALGVDGIVFSLVHHLELGSTGAGILGSGEPAWYVCVGVRRGAFCVGNIRARGIPGESYGLCERAAAELSLGLGAGESLVQAVLAWVRESLDDQVHEVLLGIHRALLERLSVAIVLAASFLIKGKRRAASARLSTGGTAGLSSGGGGNTSGAAPGVSCRARSGALGSNLSIGGAGVGGTRHKAVTGCDFLSAGGSRRGRTLSGRRRAVSGLIVAVCRVVVIVVSVFAASGGRS